MLQVLAGLFSAEEEPTIKAEVAVVILGGGTARFFTLKSIFPLNLHGWLESLVDNPRLLIVIEAMLDLLAAMFNGREYASTNG